MILNYVLAEHGFLKTHGFADTDQTPNDMYVETWAYQVSDATIEVDNLYCKNQKGELFLSEQHVAVSIAAEYYQLPGKLHTSQLLWLKKIMFGNQPNQAAPPEPEPEPIPEPDGGTPTECYCEIQN